MHSLYDVLLVLLTPFVKWYLRSRPRYRPLLARFQPPVPTGVQRPIWVHACSVGEINAAKPFLFALRTEYGEGSVVLTVSTVTGRELAETACRDTYVTWFPFDAPKTVRRFFEQLQPRALLLIESELWPNVLREASVQGVPVLVVNGRISDKHFRGFQRLARMFPRMFPSLSAAAVQSSHDASRFRDLGVPAKRVHVLGSTKFDAVRISVDTKERARLRRELGLSAEQPLIVFGSTRPGDEALAAASWSRIKSQFPEALLLIAPRHLGRLPEVCSILPEAHCRSKTLRGRGIERGSIMVLDTLGELGAIYSIASIAIIGGSFYPGVEGHNPLEPAALGIPTLFGPYMKNFSLPAQLLLDQKGAIQVTEPDALAEVICGLLRDQTECRCLGTRARKTVLENRGALDRTIALLRDILQPVDVALSSARAEPLRGENSASAPAPQ